jgi:molybdate/tungstate transport system substrate-binding protein
VAADYWPVPFIRLSIRRPTAAPFLAGTSLIVLQLACGTGADASAKRMASAHRDTVVVYLAASLTRPFQAALDTFASRTGSVIQQESGASLEHARKVTELHRLPDLMALADFEVFPQLLMPAHFSWYAEFARNRMVVAFTARSQHAATIDTSNWTQILAGNDVQVGRPDPDIAPAGYRAILMMHLAERYYHTAGLAERLLRNAPRRNMRPNAAELAALLRLGELDYIYDYESVAIANGFRYVRLPPAMDLGDPALAGTYAQVSVRVRASSSSRSATSKDSTTITGQPIVFALGVPRAAPHRTAGERLAAFLLGGEGRQMLQSAHLDMLEPPVIVGDSVPAAIRSVIPTASVVAFDKASGR